MAFIVVLDAGVIIAFLDPADVHHAAAVAALRAFVGGQLVVPASVHAEVLARPYRHNAAVATIEQFIAGLAIQVEPISRQFSQRAAQLCGQHTTLRLPDAPVHPHLFRHARVRQIVRTTKSLPIAQKQAGWSR